MPLFAYVWKDTPNPQDIGSADTEPVVTADVVSGTPSAASLAATAYAALASKSAGRRGLLLRSLGYGGRTDFGAMNAGLSLPAFLVGGFRDQPWCHFMADFWQAWKAQGSMRPDDIIVDTEYETYFEMTSSPMTAAALEAAAADGSPLQRLLPSAFRGLSAAQITAAYGPFPLTGIFDKFVREAHADSLQRMVVGTYTNIFGEAAPVTTNFGGSIARGTSYSNYLRPSFPERTTLMGVSAPVAFIQTPPILPVPKYAGLTKAIRYNDFISTLNIVRSCANIRRVWVSSWKFNGNGSPRATSSNGFRELVRHLAAMGVEKLIMFASGITSGDISIHQGILANVTPATTVPKSYPVISYDAASVTTNGYTTTYSAGDWA